MTNQSNPLLAESGLPAFDSIRVEHIEPAIDHCVLDYQQCVEALIADPATRSFAGLMAPMERAQTRLNRAWAPVGHLHGTMDSPELRDAYSAAEEKLTEFYTALGQNRALYEAVLAVQAAPGFARLSRAERTLVDDSLRGFRLSGVALEEPQRSRFAAIQTELSKLSTAFSEAVLDSTDAWSHALSDAELAGLPESARAMFQQYANERGQPGWLATLKSPSVQAIMSFADDRSLRETVYTAYHTRASDQGPHDSKHDNAERIEKILALRHEAASLLGFDSAAHESLEGKMAATPTRVLDFLHTLADKAKPVAERELAELGEFARERFGIDTLMPWDINYSAEKLREQRFDFSEEDLKPYFPVEQVMAGLFALVGRLFGVQFVARADVPLWHPDAHFFDVVDADGSVRAGVYLDLYARTGKRGGAWMDVCRARADDPAIAQKPVAFLVCNFPPPTPDLPALLTHDDVITLLHECGHGLHHMLTEIGWPSVGGISGVEWDAVELPSQFMENYAWCREGLDLLARHYQTGESLPQDLFDKMLAARHFHAGLFLVRQLEFALFDFRVHLDYTPETGARVLERLAEVRKQVAVIEPPSWHRFPNTFTHIFSGGYAAGYYSYLWAEVLSADAFAAFEECGLFDAATGQRFRDEILAVGGSRPALESFVAFRGREPEAEALLRSYGLAA
jgi:oligopeptidase A